MWIFKVSDNQADNSFSFFSIRKDSARHAHVEACLPLSKGNSRERVSGSRGRKGSMAYRVANLQSGQLGHHRSIWHARVAADHHRDASWLHLVYRLRFVRGNTQLWGSRHLHVLWR